MAQKFKYCFIFLNCSQYASYNWTLLKLIFELHGYNIKYKEI